MGEGKEEDHDLVVHVEQFKLSPKGNGEPPKIYKQGSDVITTADIY